jgi:type VI secretion system secreted protein Hcp
MAFDAFLKLDQIAGESQDSAHKGEIEIESFSWGVANTATGGGGGGGAGRAVAQDFHFTAPLSKASPNLMLACATGKHLKDGTLTLRSKNVEFLKIKLSDVLVSSYQVGGGGPDSPDLPTDQFSLHFVKIDFLYTSPKTHESVETVFNFSSNTPG